MLSMRECLACDMSFWMSSMLGGNALDLVHTQLAAGFIVGNSLF